MAKAKTRAERIVEYLTALGCTEVPCKSRKYRQFTRMAGSSRPGFYFVGRAGAWRAGMSATTSVSLDADKILGLGGQTAREDVDNRPPRP